MSRLCIIPARGGSKRFPKKNIALLNGKPLIVYSIEVALASGLFDLVVVSTEDSKIKSIARASGAVIHDRDKKLASDTVRLPDVCLNVIQSFHLRKKIFNEFCLLQVPCPLRTKKDLIESHKRLKEKNANYLISVSDYDDPPFWALYENEKGYLKFFWGDEYITMRQNLPRVVKHNGSIIWGKTDIFLEEKEFFKGSHSIPYYMPMERSIDIDYPIDMKIAEYLLKACQKLI